MLRPANSRRRTVGLLVAVTTLLPLLAGCPELRDEAVNVVENATRQFLDTTLDRIFDQFRSDVIR